MCGIQVVPEWIAELRHLSQLSLIGNDLREFPSAVFGLSSLRYLVLYGMSQIREIPSYILRLENLEKRSIDASQMREPPAEMVGQGVEAIRNFWRQRLDVGLDYLCEAKLLILGESGAGKTSRARKIQNA